MRQPARLHPGAPAETASRRTEPAAPPPPPRPPWHARMAAGFWSALGDLNQRFEALRSFVVNLAVVGGIGASLVIVVIELRKDRIIIEPIAVPAALAAGGHAPESVAGDLMNQMQAIREQANTLKKLEPVAQDNDLPDIDIPEVGFSLKPFLAYLQSLLGRDPTRVSGRIIGAPVAGYRIRLAITGAGAPVLLDLGGPEGAGAGAPPGSAEAVDPLIEQAALAVLAATDPYVVALYDYGAWSAALQSVDCTAGAAPPEIERLVGATLRNGRPDDDAWAYNLRGMVHLRTAQAARRQDSAACRQLSAREFERAQQSFERAIEEDAGLAVAYFNRGNVAASPQAVADSSWQAAEGSYRQAAEWYARAVSRAPTEADLYVEWGNSARSTAQTLAQSPPEADPARRAAVERLKLEAYQKYRQALSQDKASDAAWFGSGQMAYWLNGHKDEAALAFDQVVRQETRPDLVGRARLYRVCMLLQEKIFDQAKEEFEDFKHDYQMTDCAFNLKMDCPNMNLFDVSEIVANRQSCTPLPASLTRSRAG